MSDDLEDTYYSEDYDEDEYDEDYGIDIDDEGNFVGNFDDEEEDDLVALDEEYNDDVFDNVSDYYQEPPQDFGREAEEPVYVSTFADQSRVGFGGAFVEGKALRVQKAAQDPYERALGELESKVYEPLFANEFGNNPGIIRTGITKILGIKDIRDRLPTLNLTTLLAVAIFLAVHKQPTEENIKKYDKTLKNYKIPTLEWIRYLYIFGYN